MKKLLVLFAALLLLSCQEPPKQVYETEIKTYKISSKKEDNKGHFVDYKLYFQTPTSTESAWVTRETYEKYEVGQEIQVLIKYWEKPKNK
jgi:hypothetical protein